MHQRRGLAGERTDGIRSSPRCVWWCGSLRASCRQPLRTQTPRQISSLVQLCSIQFSLPPPHTRDTNMSSSSALMLVFVHSLGQYLEHHIMEVSDSFVATLDVMASLGDEPEHEHENEQYWAAWIALRCHLVERGAEQLLNCVWLAWTRAYLQVRPRLQQQGEQGEG